MSRYGTLQAHFIAANLKTSHTGCLFPAVQVCGHEFERDIGKGGATGKRDKVHYVADGKTKLYSIEGVESWLLKKNKRLGDEEPLSASLFSFNLSDTVTQGTKVGAPAEQEVAEQQSGASKVRPG